MDERNFRKIWETVVRPGELESNKVGVTYKNPRGTLIREAQLPIFSLKRKKQSKETLPSTRRVGASSPPSSLMPGESVETLSPDGGHVGDDSINECDLVAQAKSSLPLSANNFEVLEEIASGGMGIVYKSYQKSLCREIAIKQLSTTENSSDFSEGKFISEALVTAYLGHPNIVPVHELGESDSGEIILAMRLVGGNCWHDLLHPDTEELRAIAETYDLDAHLQILINVCNAIAFAHNKGIIHNDLKPANVMVGEFGEVLVMDWGVAVDISERSYDELRTIHKSEVHDPMGTPCYMPPELAEGHGDRLGVWTDIYLLGAILCELFTEDPPHDGETVWDVVCAARRAELPTLPADIPQELSEICYKALAKNPEDRFKSVREFQSALKNYFKHRESLIITEEAQGWLFHCEKTVSQYGEKTMPIETRNRIYDKFAQSVAGFHQARNLWKSNPQAMKGEVRARLAYAELALHNQDLGLAEAQAVKLDESHPQTLFLQKRIKMAKTTRSIKEKVSQRMMWGLAGAAIIVIFILTIVIIFVQVQKAEVERQKQKTEAQKRLVNKQRARALEQERSRTQEANAAKLTLAKIALEKASEAYDRKEWDQCGAFAGISLEFIRNLPLKQASAIKKTSQALIRVALFRKPLIWKSSSPNGGRIYSLACSPDGKYLATGSGRWRQRQGHTISIWEVTTGKQVKIIAGHSGEIHSISWSPDGKVIASGGKTVRLWEVATGKQIAVIPNVGGLQNVSWSPNGKFLACALWKIHLWDIAGRKLKQFAGHDSYITSITWSPDGKTLASASAGSAGKNLTIKLWDIVSGKQTKIFYGHTHRISALDWSPDGKTLASSSWDKTVRIWEIKSKKQIAVLHGHTDYVTSVAWSPDGKTLASASRDKTIRLWNIITHKQMAMFTGHTDYVTSVLWNTNGKTLASVSEDGSLRVWDTTPNPKDHITEGILPQFFGHTDGVTSVCFSPNGKTLASASQDKTIRLWDVATGAQTAKFTGHNSYVTSVSWNPNGKTIASASGSWEKKKKNTIKKMFERYVSKRPTSKQNKVRIWNATTGEQVAVFSAHKDVVTCVTWNPNGKILASASADKTIRIWSPSLPEPITTIKHKELAPINALCWSPDGKILASASGIWWFHMWTWKSKTERKKDNTIRLWDVATGKQIGILTGHNNGVTDVSWSPDGTTIASSSFDHTIRLWDAKTKQIKALLTGHRNDVYSLSWSPDGKILASGAKDNTVRLWDISNFKTISVFALHTSEVKAVTWSPNGKILVSASNDRTIRLWNSPADYNKSIVYGHHAPITAISWDPNNKILVSGSKDKTLRVWDIVKKKNVKVLQGYSPKTPISWRSDGKYFAFCFKNGIHVWEPKSNKEKAVLEGHIAPVTSICWSPNGKILASTSRQCRIYLWDISTGKQISALHGGTFVSWSPDGTTLATCQGKNVSLWDAATRRRTAEFSLYTDQILATVWGPNNRILACLCMREIRKNGRKIKLRNVQLWDVQDEKQITQLPGAKFLAWHPDGNMVATTANDCTISLWDTTTGKQISSFLGHKDIVSAVAWSSNGTTLASASYDHTIRFWDTTTGKQILWKMVHNKLPKVVLPQWFRHLYPHALIAKKQKSIFDFHTDIPGPLIEYALEKAPAKFTQQLFGIQITETFGVVRTLPK